MATTRYYLHLSYRHVTWGPDYFMLRPISSNDTLRSTPDREGSIDLTTRVVSEEKHTVLSSEEDESKSEEKAISTISCSRTPYLRAGEKTQHGVTVEIKGESKDHQVILRYPNGEEKVFDLPNGGVIETSDGKLAFFQYENYHDEHRNTLTFYSFDFRTKKYVSFSEDIKLLSNPLVFRDAPFGFAIRRCPIALGNSIVYLSSEGDIHIVSPPKVAGDISKIEVFTRPTHLLIENIAALPNTQLLIATGHDDEGYHTYIIDPFHKTMKRLQFPHSQPYQFVGMLTSGQLVFSTSGKLWLYAPPELRVPRPERDLTVKEIRSAAFPKDARDCEDVAKLVATYLYPEFKQLASSRQPGNIEDQTGKIEQMIEARIDHFTSDEDDISWRRNAKAERIKTAFNTFKDANKNLPAQEYHTQLKEQCTIPDRPLYKALASHNSILSRKSNSLLHVQKVIADQEQPKEEQNMPSTANIIAVLNQRIWHLKFSWRSSVREKGDRILQALTAFREQHSNLSSEEYSARLEESCLTGNISRALKSKSSMWSRTSDSFALVESEIAKSHRM